MKTRSGTVSKNVVATVAPKGRSKSGRVWKTEKQRASSLVKTKAKPGKQAVEVRESRVVVKKLSSALRDEILGQAAARREREAANKREKEANARKSEVVQVVKNPAKIKRMKKKSLRALEKRDTSVASNKTDTDPPKTRRQLRIAMNLNSTSK